MVRGQRQSQESGRREVRERVPVPEGQRDGSAECFEVVGGTGRHAYPAHRRVQRGVAKLVARAPGRVGVGHEEGGGRERDEGRRHGERLADPGVLVGSVVGPVDDGLGREGRAGPDPGIELRPTGVELPR
ncbi:hypothetical protein D3C74_410570 [compost metagenome]